MPADITIFAASYLVYIDAIVALAVVAFSLYYQPAAAAVRWLLAAVITGVLAEICAQIGGAVYNDPRPFAVDHVHPLIAHAADNGFPSDHGLLAAFLVVCVLLVRAWLAAPVIVVLGVLVDWARVGAGIHHPIDVIGSAVFVALSALVALAVTPFLARSIAPYLPSPLARPELISEWRRPSSGTRVQ
jgi:undecaprenyl-diphosphatase